MRGANTAFPLDTQKTGQLKSAFLLNALQSLYLPQGACPFVSIRSDVLCNSIIYICVRNVMPNELNDLFIINSVAVVFSLLLLCFEVTIRCVLNIF